MNIGPDTPPPQWAYLDPAPGAAWWHVQPAPLRVGVALRSGIAAGLLYAVLLLAGRVAYRASVSQATRDEPAGILAFVAAQIGLAVLIQVAVAVRVTRGLRGLGFRTLAGLHGLCAAFIAGCLAAVALLALNLVFGGTVDVSFVHSIVSIVVNIGALTALPAVALAIALSRPPLVSRTALAHA